MSRGSLVPTFWTIAGSIEFVRFYFVYMHINKLFIVKWTLWHEHLNEKCGELTGSHQPITQAGGKKK